MQAVLGTFKTVPIAQLVQVVAVSYVRQLMIDFETAEQTPLAFGKKPFAQTTQVKGAIVVAVMQFGNAFDTQEVIPLVVWRPKDGAHVAQALIEVKVRQFEAAALTQLDELNKNKP